MCLHMHMCAYGGRSLRLNILPNCSSPYFQAWVPHWPGTELTELGGLASKLQRSSSLCLPNTEITDRLVGLCPAFYGGSRDWTWILVLAWIPHSLSHFPHSPTVSFKVIDFFQSPWDWCVSGKEIVNEHGICVLDKECIEYGAPCFRVGVKN